MRCSQHRMLGYPERLVGSHSRPRVSPEPTVGDLWPHLTDLTPPAVMAPQAWGDLAPLVSALPGPVVGWERPLDDPRPSEWGFPLPRWQRAAALGIDHPHASHVAPLVRAWVDHPELDPLCDLQMHTWDIVDGASATPCVFLRVDPSADWKAMVRGYATALRDQGHVTDTLAWSDVADRLEETAVTTPLTHVASVGIYLGRPDCPVRLTVHARLRPYPDHPTWGRVDEVVAAAEWRPENVIVAFASGADPGDAWHVPLLVDRRPRPAEALRPLLAALVERGLATTDSAAAIAGYDVRRSLPLDDPTLDGVPASATVWAAPERIKVVVDPTGWRTAKADFLARVIWRSATGEVLLDH